MDLKPTRRSFMIRYFIYPYYFVLGIVFYLNFDLSGIDGNNWLFLIVSWIALTVIPGILLAFSRKKFGWFFWPAILNASGWLVRYLFPEETYNDLKPLFDNGPVLLFIVAGLLGIVFVEIYRTTFKYNLSGSRGNLWNVQSEFPYDRSQTHHKRDA